MPADDTATTVAERYRLDIVIGSGGGARGADRRRHRRPAAVAPPLSSVEDVRRPAMGPPVRTAGGPPARRFPLSALRDVADAFEAGFTIPR